jgi:hypothetical protein
MKNRDVVFCSNPLAAGTPAANWPYQWYLTGSVSTSLSIYGKSVAGVTVEVDKKVQILLN